MKTYIILLRGVNVGSKNPLPMKELKKVLSANFESVRTYIRSGNIVLNSLSDPKEEVSTIIGEHFGFSPKIMTLTASHFMDSLTRNPYPTFEGKSVHFYFCQNEPIIDHIKLDKYASDSETYEVIDKVFYLHAPDGIGRSKLVPKIEACLGVSATGRNLNTVNKLVGMLET